MLFNGRIWYCISFLSIRRSLQQLQPLLLTMQGWGVQVQAPNCFKKVLILSITIFSKVQFWQVLTRLKICLKWTPSLTFPDILKLAAYLGKNSNTEVFILKHNSNCFSIKRLHHQFLYSKAPDLTLNVISKMLWTGTITKIFLKIAIEIIIAVAKCKWMCQYFPLKNLIIKRASWGPFQMDCYSSMMQTQNLVT